MAGGVNKAILVGNLGADPEIRQTQNGKTMATFRLATSESWKDRNTGERRDHTEWHNVKVFSEGLARVVENYLRKGSKVYIEGQIQTRKYQDKDGADRYMTEIVLSGFNSALQMLDSRRDGGDGGYSGDSYPRSDRGSSGRGSQQRDSDDGYRQQSYGQDSESRRDDDDDDDVPF